MDELTAALDEHGLYFPVGHCPSVGVTGFLLGGGMGMYSAVVGAAAFSLRAIDVVTADGQALHATDDDNAELLWAARGSGPGYFAVVTRMYLDVRPRPGVVAATVQIHPRSALDQLLPWYLATGRAVEGASPLLIAGASPSFGLPDTVITLAAYVFADTLEDAAERLAPLETAPGIERALVHEPTYPTSMADLLAMYDGMYPHGLRYLSDNVHLVDVDAPGLWREFRTTVDTLPSARSCAWLLPGVTHSRHPQAAFSLQTELAYQVYAVWDDHEHDDAMLTWHSDALDRVDPYSLGGGYVGESNLYAHLGGANRQVVVVLNDNARSYDPTSGALAAHLRHLRAGTAGRTNLFEAMGFGYIGPVDGHDIAATCAALRQATEATGPVLVHAVTAKGRGYPPAESDDADRMHACGVVDIVTGRPTAAAKPSWTDVFAAEMVRVGDEFAHVVAMTAAMRLPTGLGPFSRRYPERMFDSGIAEQHLLASAAGRPAQAPTPSSPSTPHSCTAPSTSSCSISGCIDYP